ncbi:MAG: peptidylprolyl isomerase [Verrucomicrobiota bacterium]
MTTPGKFPLCLAISGAVLLYLAGDLFLFHGPLRHMLDSHGADETEIVARVASQPITRGQLERAAREQLWLDGKNLESLTPENRKIARFAALDELIDHELLRIKTHEHAPELKVSEEEITSRFNEFSARFESPEEMESAMKSQGIGSKKDLRHRLAAQIQQEKYVESMIGPISKVSDEEARQWFTENQKGLAIPERIQACHVFIATLEHPQEEAKAKLETALADLTNKKKDFATLAKELSEDPATKDSGGALGWMTRNRLPADFANPVFALPLNQPSLVRTKIGWHLVEVTSRKPAESRTYEDAKAEVISALEAVKRQQTITQYRSNLRRFETEKIEVFRDKITD